MVTFSFDTHGRTNIGVGPKAAVQAARHWELAAAGANCGATLEMTEEALRALARVVRGGVMPAGPPPPAR